MVDAATPTDYSVLHYGDSIAFQVDGGYLACPSFYYEAIPDASEAVRYAQQFCFSSAFSALNGVPDCYCPLLISTSTLCLQRYVLQSLESSTLVCSAAHALWRPEQQPCAAQCTAQHAPPQHYWCWHCSCCCACRPSQHARYSRRTECTARGLQHSLRLLLVP
jgi:hypothetical protein